MNTAPDVGSGQITVPRPYGYAMGACFAVVLLLTVLTYGYYIHRRNHPDITDNHHPFRRVNSPELQRLDETILQAYPKLLYSQVKNDGIKATAAGCSICLQDYEESDLLRSLPKCGHFFHLKCVDPWLMIHPTCPKFTISVAPADGSQSCTCNRGSNYLARIFKNLVR